MDSHATEVNELAVTLSLLPLEQGTLSYTGENQNSTTRCRTPSYLSIPANTWEITVYAAGNAPMQYSFVGYDKNNTLVCNLYWHDSGETLSLAQYSEVVKFRCCVKYADNSTIIPENVENAILQYNVMWYINESGDLTNDYMPDVLSQMEQPFPYALWRVENGILQNKLAPNGELVGAFANATSLQKVHIPKSCKKIGMYAFRNTQLMSVTIASDCEYYNTSFPDGCTINFYPD